MRHCVDFLWRLGCLSLLLELYDRCAALGSVQIPSDGPRDMSGILLQWCPAHSLSVHAGPGRLPISRSMLRSFRASRPM